jgi:hypothetical protein
MRGNEIRENVIRGNEKQENMIRENVSRGNVNSGKCIFVEIIFRENVNREEVCFRNANRGSCTHVKELKIGQKTGNLSAILNFGRKNYSIEDVNYQFVRNLKVNF